MSTDWWTPVMDRLLAGFAHDANGRATALRGVAIIAADGDPPEEWMPLLESEALRLEQLAAGLSALRVEAPEPVDARDVLHAVEATLGAVHIRLRHEDLPHERSVSVLVSRGALVRTLVALAFQLVPAHTAAAVHARVLRLGADVVLELWVEKATSSGSVPVSLPGAQLSTVPGGYRLALPALDP